MVSQKQAIAQQIARENKYGLAPGEYQRMSKAQNGLCAICLSRPFTGIDHCHKTKLVRGLLCSQCNTGIGMFGDDPDRLLLARKYLLRENESLLNSREEKKDLGHSPHPAILPEE